MVRLENVGLRYGYGPEVLKDISFRLVPGEFFVDLVKDFQAVRRFQVVQRDSASIELRVVVNDHWSDEIEQFLKKEIARVLGPQVKIEVVVVEDIPLTTSGKLQVVVRDKMIPNIG